MTADKIYVDASRPSTLRHAGGSVECPTLHEAVIAWRALPEKDRHQATIQVRRNEINAVRDRRGATALCREFC